MHYPTSTLLLDPPPPPLKKQKKRKERIWPLKTKDYKFTIDTCQVINSSKKTNLNRSGNEL